jgi:hypothetical protein
MLSYSADMDSIRSNIFKYFTAYGADRSDPIVAAAISTLNDSAHYYQNTMQADGSWPNIDYTEVPFTDWPVGWHYQHMMIMAKAYNTPGQDLYQSSALLLDLEKAVTLVQSYFSLAADIGGNWWWGDIGIPLRYGPMLAIMQGKMDTAVFNPAAATLRDFVRVSHGAGVANGTWARMCKFYSVVIDSSISGLNNIKTTFTDYLVISNSLQDAMQPDYSWHSHGAQLYTGGYGGAFAQEISRYCYYVRGTSFQLPQTNFELLTDYAAEGVRWCLSHNYWDPAVISRGISRSYSKGSYGIGTMLLLSQFDNPHRDEFIAGAKKMIETWDEYSLETAGLAYLTNSSQLKGVWPTGHKHYWCSDYTIHRRPGQYISIKMFSDRILSGEGTNNEGKKSWNLADGFTYILRGNGGEYRSNNVIPTMDWHRLAGTTAEKKSKTMSYKGWMGLGFRSFVGGCTDGQNGTTAMDFADQKNYGPSESALSAKKSWFFFNNEMVCLGTAINCTTTNTIETIVNQRPIPQPDAPLYVDGAAKPATLGWEETMTNITWAHFDSIGYYFPGGQDITGMRKAQSGSWLSLNDMNDSVTHTNNFITLLYDHGTQVSGGTYSYGVVMNNSHTEMAAYASAAPFTILKQNDSIHAVKHNINDALGAVFWEAGSVDKITVDKPCIIYYEKSGSTYTVALSRPIHDTTTVTLTFNERLYDVSLASGVSSTSDLNSTTITYNTERGQNYLCTFSMLPVQRIKQGVNGKNKTFINVWPNPFSMSVDIFVRHPSHVARQEVRLEVFNITGKRIANIKSRATSDERRATNHTWHAQDQPNGVYMIRVKVGNRVLSKKVALNR